MFNKFRESIFCFLIVINTKSFNKIIFAFLISFNFFRCLILFARISSLRDLYNKMWRNIDIEYNSLIQINWTTNQCITQRITVPGFLMPLIYIDCKIFLIICFFLHFCSFFYMMFVCSSGNNLILYSLYEYPNKHLYSMQYLLEYFYHIIIMHQTGLY